MTQKDIAAGSAPLWLGAMSASMLHLVSRFIIREIPQKAFSPAFKPRLGDISKLAVCSHCLIQTKAADMVVKVHVVYCRHKSCSNPRLTSYIRALRTFWNNVTCIHYTSESTPSTTGWFEVQVNGTLVHSKKNGDGFPDNDQKFAQIVSAIKKALGK
ncbi:Selenoprotein W [Bagarius yarrelli]|uniref:Selenoprotein W n=1 Tax=Bagarius yarrelli TaxID=175774 RepID=A0A556UY02_BAGYA|nr:Selenoprotein W [Bagarius yarrelli]